ncbi:MAG: site-specific integrase [Pseudomonadota bacterium]
MPDNLYKRNGIYYARIQVAGRDKRRSLQTGNLAEAKARLKMYLKAQSAYHGTVRMKFEDVTGAFLDDAQTTLKPKTHTRYKSSIFMLSDTFAGKWWDAITTESLLAYIAERKAAGAKIPTIKRDLTALSQAAEYAIEQQWAGTNPVTAIPKRPLRYKTPTFKRPSARSVELGISCAHGNIRPLAGFLRATGMRLEEAVTLERNQIDRRRRVATLTETKNGSARTVSLNDAAIEILKVQSIATDLVFPAIDRVTGEARPYKQASTNWQMAQQRAITSAAKQGWTFERFRLHDLRHIFAIDYLANGGNIYLLQQQLGHGSIRQTEWYLQFLSPDEQIAAKFGSAQKPSHAQRFPLAGGDENG